MANLHLQQKIIWQKHHIGQYMAQKNVVWTHLKTVTIITVPYGGRKKASCLNCSYHNTQ